MSPWIESFCRHIVPVVYSFIIMFILSTNAAKEAFKDCTESCIFPLEYSISTNNTIDYVSLSSAFQISFDLKLWRSAPQTANIFDIYSLSSGTSLLSFSLESGTNTLQVYYKGSAVSLLVRYLVQAIFSSCKTPNDCDSRFSLEKIQTSLSTSSRLGARQKSPASALNNALQARESSHGTVPFHPSFPIESVAIGAFYLEAITDKYERIYKRR